MVIERERKRHEAIVYKYLFTGVERERKRLEGVVVISVWELRGKERYRRILLKFLNMNDGLVRGKKRHEYTGLIS